MNRQLGLTLLIFALMVAVLAAQDAPPGAQKEQPGGKKTDPQENPGDRPIKKLEKKEPATGPASGDDVQKIIERLNKNMDSSEERLNKKDPGADTRKIQGDIIKDLDELIKQQNKGEGGGGGGGGASSSSSTSGSKGSSAKGSGKSKASSQAKSKGNKVGDKRDGDPTDFNDSQKKNNPDKLGHDDDKEKDKDKQVAKDKTGKEGKGGDGMGGNPNAKDKKDNSTIGDLFKDVWGHLPLSKRQEMDAYSKERFLAKYDEILRQYYRTISEQGRHREGD